MTLREFSALTDWPYAEFESMHLSDAEELFALYGLELEVTLPARTFAAIIAFAEVHGFRP